MQALPNNQETKASATGNYLFPLILITSLFFFWGFIHNLDPILIPHLRRGFRLSTLQASFVDSAVFIAYFFMAIPAGILMKKFGYKTGIITGLMLFAFGCFLFVPAANYMQYAFFLGALFIVACGLTVLETAANPYVSLLGPSETSTQRLNFAQSFNGLAAFIAPIIGGKFILSDAPLSNKAFAELSATAKTTYLQSETSTVKMPYIILGLVILLVAIIFLFTKLPEIKDNQKDAKKGFFHAFAHKHLKWAVVAQFFYVGAQVCVLSFLVLFATKVAGITEKQAAYYSGLAGLVFMLGRFAGTFFMKFIPPPKLLTIYSLVCIMLSLIAIFGSGIITLYAVNGIAFFMSIMFPTIFALGIKDLGADTKSASSLIVMSVVGGAALPPILGYIADATQNIQYGYVVPLCCFIVTALFGWKGYKTKLIN
ncbi:MAG: L-fucose:H+ symporter permease [Ginsengibacter sp.]